MKKLTKTATPATIPEVAISVPTPVNDTIIPEVTIPAPDTEPVLNIIPNAIASTCTALQYRTRINTLMDLTASTTLADISAIYHTQTMDIPLVNKQNIPTGEVVSRLKNYSINKMDFLAIGKSLDDFNSLVDLRIQLHKEVVAFINANYTHDSATISLASNAVISSLATYALKMGYTFTVSTVYPFLLATLMGKIATVLNEDGTKSTEIQKKSVSMLSNNLETIFYHNSTASLEAVLSAHEYEQTKRTHDKFMLNLFTKYFKVMEGTSKNKAAIMEEISSKIKVNAWGYDMAKVATLSSPVAPTTTVA